jgi:hypothetical protein
MFRRCGRCESVESLIDLSHGTSGRWTDADEARDGLTAPGEVITRIDGFLSVAGPEASPYSPEEQSQTYTKSLKPA